MEILIIGSLFFIIILLICLHYIIKNIRNERKTIFVNKNLTLDQKRDIDVLVEAYLNSKFLIKREVINEKENNCNIHYTIKFNNQNGLIDCDN